MARKSSRPPFAPTSDHRLFLLHGKEAFLMRERSQQIVAALEAGHGNVDQFVFDGADADLADVLDELRSYGLLQQHKLVIVDRADQFLTNRDSRRRALENYAAAPVDHSTLLLRAETWRPDKLSKAIAASGLVYKVEAVDDHTAASWCIARCKKRHGASLEPEAASMLVAQIGPSLDRLDTEIGKLASFAGSDRPIGTADVVELVGLSREQQAWIIQEAIASGDVRRAVRTLRELRQVSGQPEQLLGWAVTDFVRKLHAGSQLFRRGVDSGRVAKEIKLWGEGRNRILSLAGSIDPARLAQLLRTCIETDWRSKSGIGQGPRSLEALTVLVTDSMRSSTRH
jgi:DNA polymerase-3 subunit delta